MKCSKLIDMLNLMTNKFPMVHKEFLAKVVKDFIEVYYCIHSYRTETA